MAYSLNPHFSPDSQIETLYGVRITVNRSFPIKSNCAICEGSGEGHYSTYCPHCEGAGEVEIEGAWFMDGPDQLKAIRNKLPRKFEPRATFTVAPPTMKGLP